MKTKYAMSLPVLVVAALIVTDAQPSTADPVGQPEIKAAPEAAEVKQWRDLRVREVSSRIMAWWLDPRHNATPLEYEYAQRNLKLVSAPGAVTDDSLTRFRPETARQLPKDVEYVFELSSHNALHVFSTEQGFRELEAIVTLLDKRLTQVEIEGTFVEVTPQGAKALAGQHYMNTDESRVLLNKLIAEKNAVVVMSPRFTTFNNLPGNLGSSVSMPAVVNVKDSGGRFALQVNTVRPSVPTAAGTFITDGFSFVVTPTVNADKTITLLIQPVRTLRLTTGHLATGNNKQHDDLLLQTLQSVKAVANLKENQTVVLTGLNPQIVRTSNSGNASRTPTAHEKKSLVLFVTAYDIERLRQAQFKLFSASQAPPLDN